MIKNIILNFKDAPHIGRMFLAAGVGICADTHEFITLHGRKILQDSKDEASIRERDEIVARAVTLCVGAGDSHSMPSVMQTVFNHHESVVMHSHPLSLMFSGDERQEALDLLGGAYGFKDKSDKLKGQFGRIAISKKYFDKASNEVCYQLNATYRTIEIIKTPKREMIDQYIANVNADVQTNPDAELIEIDESILPDEFYTITIITHDVDVLMINFYVSLKDIALSADQDRLSDEAILAPTNIPVNSACEIDYLFKTRGENIDNFFKNEESLSQAWITALAWVAGLKSLKSSSSDDLVNLRSLHEKVIPFRVFQIATDVAITHLSYIRTGHSIRGGADNDVFERAVAVRDVFGNEYNHNGNSKSAWKSEVGGHYPRINFGSSDGTTVVAIVSYFSAIPNHVEPNAIDKDTLDSLLLSAVTAFNEAQKKSDVNNSYEHPIAQSPASADGCHVVSVLVSDIRKISQFTAFVRDHVTRALLNSQTHTVPQFSILGYEAVHFEKKARERLSDSENPTYAILHSMREVFNLFDIPNMPGVAGDFFRKVEACDSVEEAAEIVYVKELQSHTVQPLHLRTSLN